jgi:hypothetical protein
MQRAACSADTACSRLRRQMDDGEPQPHIAEKHTLALAAVVQPIALRGRTSSTYSSCSSQTSTLSSTSEGPRIMKACPSIRPSAHPWCPCPRVEATDSRVLTLRGMQGSRIEYGSNTSVHTPQTEPSHMGQCSFGALTDLTDCTHRVHFDQAPPVVTMDVILNLGNGRMRVGIHLDDKNNVLQVLPGTVAEAAGIRRFDVLLKLNGEPLAGHKFGEKRLEAMLKNRKTAVLTIRRSPNLLHKLGHKSFLTKHIEEHLTSEAEVWRCPHFTRRNDVRMHVLTTGLGDANGHDACVCAAALVGRTACGRHGCHGFSAEHPQDRHPIPHLCLWQAHIVEEHQHSVMGLTLTALRGKLARRAPKHCSIEQIGRSSTPRLAALALSGSVQSRSHKVTANRALYPH